MTSPAAGVAHPRSSHPVPAGDLRAIGEELDRLGYVVVPHGSELCVRLPLLCSVRLRSQHDRVRLVAKFGPLSRSAALLTTAGVSAAAVAATAFTFGVTPGTLVVAFAGIAALTIDACRFIVTEGCLARLQHLLDGPRRDA